MTDSKRRRASGTGSVRTYTTSAGERFYICYRIPDDENGKTKQKVERGFETVTEAEKALRDRLVKIDRHEYVEPTKRPARDYLTEWVAGLRNEPSTIASYRRNLELHVIPRIGATPLGGITATQLTSLYRDLETGGRRDKRQGSLSARTVRYIATIVHRAFRDAVADGLLAVNPAGRAKVPSAKQAQSPEMKTWTAGELRSFLAWSTSVDDDLVIAWRLLAMTGMRRGEALALRWSDVDWTAGTLAVRRSTGVIRVRGEGEQVFTGLTKSGKSRVVDLDPQTLALLKAYRAGRASVALSLVRDDAVIVSNPDGTPRHPERFSREFVRRLERCQRDLAADEKTAPSTIRLHDLRHTHATLALTAGIHPKVISERLGHAKVSITMDVYSHALPSMQREAAAAMAALVYGGSA
jgi:integrase